MQEILTVFYKNLIPFPRTKRVKNAKIHRFLPTNWHYHGAISNNCWIIGSFL